QLPRLVKTARAPHLCTLDGLAVHAAGAGRGLTRLQRCRVDRGAADPLTQRVVEALPGAILTPLGEVIVDLPPGTEILRQHPPLTPRLVAVENPVHHPPQVRLAGTAPLRGGNQRLQYRPLLICHVAWVCLVHPLFLGILLKQALTWSATASRANRSKSVRRNTSCSPGSTARRPPKTCVRLSQSAL